MTITKRTLEKWRKEALVELKAFESIPDDESRTKIYSLAAWQERILRLTQVLLDQHLIRRKS